MMYEDENFEEMDLPKWEAGPHPGDIIEASAPAGFALGRAYSSDTLPLKTPPIEEALAETVSAYLAQKGLPRDTAVTFDDVTLLDFYSDIPSRGSITDSRSRLAKDIWLNTPIVSANMDTITEAKMAIALARLGGLGFIHQFLPIEKRIQEIKKVKRADSGIIENPLTIRPEATLREAREIMGEGPAGLLVLDPATEKLVGIITARDVRFEKMDDKRVAEIMTHAPLITAPAGTTPEQARTILQKNKIEKLPLVDGNERVVGLITSKDILKIEQFPQALRDEKGHLMVLASVGVSGDFLREAELLAGAGADVILVDTARGFSARLQDAVRAVRSALGEDIPIVAGNVDTPEATLMLIEAGADAIKVGIGPGAVCKTREGPGVGTPQITAIAECVAVARRYDVPIIADGGIRGGAHFCKALAAGASSVMLGWLLAGAEETPGEPFYEDGEKWKIYRGSASLEFQLSRLDRDETERIRASEGVPRRVRYRGEVGLVIDELMGYLRSSMSYVGAWTLEEYRQKAKFRRQTLSGYEEGKPV